MTSTARSSRYLDNQSLISKKRTDLQRRSYAREPDIFDDTFEGKRSTGKPDSRPFCSGCYRASSDANATSPVGQNEDVRAIDLSDWVRDYSKLGITK